MTSFKQTFTRLSRLMFLGFHGPRGGQMKQFVICQWIACAVLLFLWIKINGGLWPSSLQPGSGSSPRHILDVNLVDHFVSAQHDGSMIMWSHGANSREQLKQALTSDIVMMIEADVILRGQNTADQQMVPVMARPPDTTSDITLAEWLALVKGRGKGLKLDFKSIEAVEISLQTLNEIKEELNAPLHLSAAVLNSSDTEMASERVLDAGRFVRLCTTYTPDCTLALGWVTGHNARRYSWSDIKAMYDLLDRWHVRQPVAFNVRADLVRRSLPQLKWLLEMMPASTITIVQPQHFTIDQSQLLSSTDLSRVPLDDLMYVRRRVPRHAVFYDLSRSDHVEFSVVKDTTVTDAYNRDVAQMDEERSFNADQWKVVLSREGELVYLGTQSVLLQTGLLITRAEYPASPQHPVFITGRVEFFDVPRTAVDTQRDEISLSVFLRASQSSRPDSISGILCFFSISGEIRLELQRIPGSVAKSHAILPGTAPCLALRITDCGVSGITADVVRPKSCDSDFDLATDIDFQTTVEMPLSGVTTDKSFIAIKQSLPVGFVAIDQFSISTRRPKQ